MLVYFVVIMLVILFRGLVINPIIFNRGQATTGYVYAHSSNKTLHSIHYYYVVEGQTHCSSMMKWMESDTVTIHYLKRFPQIHMVPENND